MSGESKASNFFAVIRENQKRELSDAYHCACTYMAEECERCPLVNTEKCALVELPEKPLRDHRVEICSDWISLHFREVGRG